MGKRSSKAYYIWGQFGPIVMRELTGIKAKVNAVLDGPLFDVHLTLTGPLRGKETTLLNRFNTLQNELGPLDISLKQYGISEKFYESLYIVVERSDALLDFKKKIDNTFKINPKPFSPHISLFYGKESIENKRAVISSLPGFSSTIRLNKFCLVIIGENIDQWKVEREITLC